MAFVSAHCIILAFVVSGITCQNNFWPGQGPVMATGSNVPGRPLVILAAPRKSDAYYQDRFNILINFYIQYAQNVIGKDNILILADSETIPYLKGQYPQIINGSLPSDILVTASIQDIWMRDSGTVRQNRPVKLKYQPNYMSKREGTSIDNTVMKFFNDMGVTFNNQQQQSFGSFNNAFQQQYQIPHYPNLILDGGNVVDNKIDKAIVTDRIYKDNPKIQSQQLNTQLQNALGYNKLSVITESVGDTTGHSDGMLSFIDTNTLAIAELDEPERSKLWRELQNSFGNEVKMIELPSYYVDEKDYHGFTSACGAHVNALVTNSYIYVPTYGHDPEAQAKGFTTSNDDKVIQIIQQNTSKRVIRIPVPYKICLLGGSVRCLSMQIEGPIADMLVQKAKTATVWG